MLLKHLVRTPVMWFIVGLAAVVAATIITPSAGFAQPTDAPATTSPAESHSPESIPESQVPTDPVASTPSSPKPTTADPTSSPDEAEPDVDVEVELYDADEQRLDDKTVSADQQVIASATIRDPELTQLLEQEEDIGEAPAIEIAVKLPTDDAETFTYEVEDLEPKLDDDGDPIADTFWMHPATVASDDPRLSLPEDADGLITVAASYDRLGAFEEPIVSEEVEVFLDTTPATIDSLTYVDPDETQQDVVMDDYVVADGKRYLELTVEDEQTADNLELTPETVTELQERFTDLWGVSEVTVSHNGDPVATKTVTDGEAYRIVLDEAREYNLELLEISVTDGVGNTETYNAHERNVDLNPDKHQIPTTIAIDRPDADWYTRVLVDDGTKEHVGRKLVINHEAPKVILESNKPFFPQLLVEADKEAGWGRKPALTFEHAYGAHSKTVQVSCDAEPKATDNGVYRVECSFPTAFGGTVTEGAYNLAETSVDNQDDVQWSHTTGYLEVTDVILDTTAPEAAITTRPDPDHYEVIAELTEEHTEHDAYRGEALLVGDEKGVEYGLRLTDVFPEGHPGRKERTASPTGTAGLDPDSVTVQYPVPTDLNGKPFGRSSTQHLEVDRQGKVNITFGAEGVYDLSQVTVTAQDHAGNVLEKLPLATLLDDSEPRLIVVTPSESPARTGIEITPAQGVPASTDDGRYFRGDVDMTFTIRDPWFPLYRALADDFDAFLKLSYSYSNTSDEKTEVDLDLDPKKFARGKNHTWVYTDIELPRAQDSDQPLEARYELAWEYPGLNLLANDSKTSGRQAFWVDYTSPVITDATAQIQEEFWFLDELSEEHVGQAHYAGEPLLVSPDGTSVRYRVNVKDLFPHGHPAHDEPTGTTHSPAGVAGLDAGSVRFRVPERTDLDGQLLAQAEVTHPELTEHGTFWIELSGEGLYDLSKVMISAKDQAGNELKPISLYEALSAENSTHHKFVVVNRSDSPVAADLTVTRAEDVPTSTDNSYYYRGDINATLSVTDRWFPLYLAREPQLENLVTLSYNTSPAVSDRFRDANLQLGPQQFVAGEEYQWVYHDLALPRAPGSKKPLEANYALSWDYPGLDASVEHAETTGRHDFVVDYTGPQLGELQFSDLSNIRHEWIIADEAYRVTLQDVSDPIAGIDPESVGFHRFEDQDWREPVSRVGFEPGVSDLAVDPAPKPQFTGSDDHAGKISFDITGDSQRLYLHQTVIGLTDKAGNPVDTGLLNRYESTELELRPNEDGIHEGPRAIVVASAQPALSLRYDHDDVRNGHYYNTDRIATITVTDANFDLLQDIDGLATVMTATVDDAERTVNVEDFSNPSEDGQTWVATYEFDTDGDWEITAQATTISDKTSETFTDEWTLDTMDPMIMVDFGPEAGETGQYFNTPRTATVRIDERNFSPEDTAVQVSAETADGSSAPAPSGSGWSQGEDDEWVQTFTFVDELVYNMSIDTVDLAGNTTDTYEVPEFIVDLTAPDVQISQVEDSTAYAGVVAPQVEVSDIYLSPSEVEYVLEGFNQGPIDSTTHVVTENFDDTSWQASWDDFPRDIAVDDVYTLSVTATDRAGNSTSDAVNFSVNRFGSTYMFSDGTDNLRGQYLKEPIDVEITEINVSGIAPEQTEVSVAENDQVRTLDDADFDRENTSVDNGWQAMKYTLPAELFDASAYFRIMLSSVDEAGNLSQNTMEHKSTDRESSAEVKFAVDQIAPNVTLGDVESGSVYYSPVKNIIPDVKDNLALESVTMTVDGQPVLEASGRQALTEILAYELPADAQEHTIDVAATDKAGNVTTAHYANVVVVANFWQYLASHPWLAAALVAGGIALLAAVVGSVVGVIRRRRRLAYRRNPFGL